MAPAAISPPLEREDHVRDAAFNKILHGTSAEKRGGMIAMMKKDALSQKAALDEYFKHWDNKTADVETEEIRKARRDEYASLTRQYVFQSETCGHCEADGQLLIVTTISPLTSMSMVGVPRSTFVASHMASPSTAP